MPDFEFFWDSVHGQIIQTLDVLALDNLFIGIPCAVILGKNCQCLTPLLNDMAGQTLPYEDILSSYFFISLKKTA